MRRLLVLVLTIILVLSTATVAFALEGGYIEPDGSTPNPHFGYSDATNHCKVCHAVHGANATDPVNGLPAEALLRTTKNNACVYCHIQATYSIDKPYGDTETNYTDEAENNHASVHPEATPTATGYKGCVTCHSVHSTNTIAGSLAGKILKKNPGGGLGVNGVGCLAADATTEDEFCRDCHDATSATGQTFWTTDPAGDIQACNDCHAYTQLGYVYNDGSRNGVSHIMTTTTTNADGVTQGAWDTSETCRKCHMGGGTDEDPAFGNNFPHYTTGLDFLNDSYDGTVNQLDSVCLDCHQSGGAGVGLTY